MSWFAATAPIRPSTTSLSLVPEENLRGDCLAEMRALRAGADGDQVNLVPACGQFNLKQGRVAIMTASSPGLL